MYTTHGSPSSAQAVAVATPCWPAPVSAMTRVLPRRRVSSDWPRALLGEILALQVEAQGRGDGAAGCCGGRALQDPGGEAVGAVQRGRAAGEGREELAQLRPKARVVAELGVRRLQLRQGAHERLGDIAAAELALEAPATSPVCFEQARLDGRRAGGEVRAIGAGGAGTLDEERDAERVLARRLAARARGFGPGGDVDAYRWGGSEGTGDVGRIEPPGQDDRDFMRDRGNQPLIGAGAGATRVRAAGGVQEDSLGAGVEVGTRAIDERQRFGGTRLP